MQKMLTFFTVAHFS